MHICSISFEIKEIFGDFNLPSPEELPRIVPTSCSSSLSGEQRLVSECGHHCIISDKWCILETFIFLLRNFKYMRGNFEAHFLETLKKHS